MPPAVKRENNCVKAAVLLSEVERTPINTTRQHGLGGTDMNAGLDRC